MVPCFHVALHRPKEHSLVCVLFGTLWVYSWLRSLWRNFRFFLGFLLAALSHHIPSSPQLLQHHDQVLSTRSSWRLGKHFMAYSTVKYVFVFKLPNQVDGMNSSLSYSVIDHQETSIKAGLGTWRAFLVLQSEERPPK